MINTLLRRALVQKKFSEKAKPIEHTKNILAGVGKLVSTGLKKQIPSHQGQSLIATLLNASKHQPDNNELSIDDQTAYQDGHFVQKRNRF